MRCSLYPNHPQRLLCRAFTLLELIVVMVIATVLLGIGASMFAKLQGSQGKESAARMLSRQVYLARQYAISEREHVALLLPEPDDNGGAVDGAYAGSSLRTAIVQPNTGANHTFLRYVDNSEWIELPAGVFVRRTDSESASELCDGVEFPNEGSGDIYNGVRCIVFRPKGTAYSTTDATFEINRGHVDSGNIILDDDTLPVTDQTRINVTINWLTGRLEMN